MSDRRSGPATAPWEFVIDGDWPMIYSAALDEDGHRIPVADLFHGGYDFADLGFPLAANGRLMAAAPELLEVAEAAFKALCEHAPGLDHLVDRLEAVISKATGDDHLNTQVSV